MKFARLCCRTVLALAIAGSACADKAVSPGESSTRVLIDASIAAQSGVGSVVDVYVSYARIGGAIIPLTTHRESVSPGTREISVTVDLAPCLADPQRPPPLSDCALRLDIVLRDANNVALDSITTTSLNASLGETTSVSEVGLTAGVEIGATFCTDAQPTVFAAYQDGTGPWTPLNINGGSAAFRIKSGRGGLTWVRSTGTGGWSITTQLASISELPQLSSNTCTNAAGTATVSGVVTNLPPNEFLQINIGGRPGSVIPPANTFQILNVPIGTHSLFAIRNVINGNTADPQSVIVRRNVQVQGNVALTPIDAVTASPLETYPVSFTGALGQVTTYSAIANPSGLASGVWLTPASNVWRAIPSTLLVPGEVHFIQAIDSDTTGGATRTAYRSSATSGAMTLAFGPPLSAASITVAATQPYVRASVTLAAQQAYPTAHQLNLTQGAGATARSWYVQATGGYVGNGSSVTVSIPNLSGVAGWNNTWGIQAGLQTQWSIGGTGITGTGTVYTPFGNGTSTVNSYRLGSITP